MNATAARIGTSAATPADGELVVGTGTPPFTNDVTISASSPTIGLYSDNPHGSARNWAIRSYHTNYGDLCFSTSAAKGGNPLDGGTALPRLTIDSAGNVGIGTSTPTVGNLQIRDDSVSILALTRTTASTSSDIGMVRFGNTDVDSNLANIVAYHDGANDSAKLVFQTQATSGSTADRLTIDSAGKVGIGVTPETWHSSYVALQVGGLGCLSSYSPATITGDTKLTSNVYRAADGTFKRIILDHASEYQQGTGKHTFKVAASGAADAEITWTDALTIDNTGLATFANGIAFQSATTGSGTGTGYTLDSYETGTWTPNLKLGGSNTGITFSTQAGTYTKTGNVVNYWFSFALTSKGSQTGSITIDDLPFTNQAESTGAGNFNYIRNVAGTNWEKSFHLTLGGSDDLLYARYINGTDYEVLADTDITDTTIMYGGGSYITTA